MSRMSAKDAYARAVKMRKYHKRHGTTFAKLGEKFGVSAAYACNVVNKVKCIKIYPEGEYREVPDFPDYVIQDGGRIFNIYSGEMKCGKNKDGYPKVTLQNGHGRKGFFVHVLVCRIYNGEPEHESLQVRHLDGTKDNNWSTNLAWGTSLENAEDKKVHGTYQCGSKQSKAKLTEKKVEKIVRRFKKSGLSKREFARTKHSKYGISRKQLLSILRGNQWKEQTEELSTRTWKQKIDDEVAKELIDGYNELPTEIPATHYYSEMQTHLKTEYGIEAALPTIKKVCTGKTFKHLHGEKAQRYESGILSLPEEKRELLIARRKDFMHLPRTQFASMAASKLRDQGFDLTDRNVQDYLKSNGL